MKKIHLFVLLIIAALGANAQDSSYQKQTATALQVIDAYNRQDFSAMKKPWFWVGKVVVRKKALKKEFQPYFDKYGKATIDTLLFSNPWSCVAVLKMEKDPSKRSYFSILMNDKAKIEGMGFTYPPFFYRQYRPVEIIDQNVLEDSIASLLGRRYKSFNGSIMVLEHGQSIYQSHHGYTNLIDSTQEPNSQTLYELASVSKQFTAYALLILEQRGLLKLEDSLNQHIPELDYPVTLHQILNHSSGIPEYFSYIKKHWDHNKIITNEDLIHLYDSLNPNLDFTPGSRWRYSNTGYLLAASVVERSMKMPFSACLDSLIFRPLNMTRTQVIYGRRGGKALPDNYALGYVYDKSTKTYQLPDSVKAYDFMYYMDGITGDGTVNTCMDDFVKWENELLHPTLLHPEQAQKAIANYPLIDGEPSNYGYGWMLRDDVNLEPMIFHTGGWPGYHTIILRFPELKRTVIILNNTYYDSFTRLADDIAALLSGQY